MTNGNGSKRTTEYKPMNYRIISIRTARRILHVEDCLTLGKIRFELWDYARGQGAAAHVDAYLDADTARVLAAELATGKLATTDGLETMGGGTVKGQLTSRILKLETADTRNPIRITVKNGPGARQTSGLISPQKGAKMTALQILLSHLDAKRTGLAILHHLQAWATVTYLDRIESETWRPRSVTDLADTPPPDFLDEPSADPATGEMTGNGDLVLRYGNGSPVSDNPDERKAYRAHIATVKAIPASIDALREWAKALTSNA